MKKLLMAFLGLFVLSLASPRLFAIDALLHDVVDHTIGGGHHRHYYNYNYNSGGYPHSSSYSGYGHHYYSHTHRVWSGGHHRHHSTALTVFGHGPSHHRGH